ncbi:hypothetical protein H0W26_06190 [Candidatus Dependentiae bacterium]|nr:hypothetical protein [Candidatus Dependentiae bacterium]
MTIFKRASLIDAIGAAWDTYRNNASFFLTASIVGVLISGIFIGVSIVSLIFSLISSLLYISASHHLVSMVSGGYLKSFPFFSSFFPALLPTLFQILMVGVGFLLHLLVDYQVLSYGARLYKGETPSWHTFFRLPSSNFLLFLLARMRFFIIAGLGLLCFIVPGILYICSNYFAGYSIIHSLTGSLKKDALMSNAITKHNRWRIFMLRLVTFMGGLLFSYVGLGYIITPFILLMNLDMYHQLRHLQLRHLHPEAETAP